MTEKVCLNCSVWISFAGTPQRTHPAIPEDDIKWLHEFMLSRKPGEMMTFNHAVHVMKRKLFPFEHNPYPWTAVELLFSLHEPY